MKSSRYGFGHNWQRFIAEIDEPRIALAEKHLSEMIEMPDLRGRSFLDIGSGSGLFSLAATRLGAIRVHSFDYDPSSVAATEELKQRFAAGTDWTIEQGDVLDSNFIENLGKWDVVYSWGVLHHTGAMWKALRNAAGRVGPDGLLFIAIYNNEGLLSRRWRRIKRLYNSGVTGRLIILTAFIPRWVWGGLRHDLLRLKSPLARYRRHSTQRGMSIIRDWADWLGGYPFEYAAPEDIWTYAQSLGFELVRLKTTNGHGNNEFVLRIVSKDPVAICATRTREVCVGHDLEPFLRSSHKWATGSFDYAPFASRSGAPLRMTVFGSFSTAC